MRDKTREALDAIDEVLARNDTVAGELWEVLTALRGPDGFDSYRAKTDYTARIRATAFPKAAAGAESNHMSFYAHGAEYSAVQGPVDLELLQSQQPHFRSHTRLALIALELIPLSYLYGE